MALLSDVNGSWYSWLLSQVTNRSHANGKVGGLIPGCSSLHTKLQSKLHCHVNVQTVQLQTLTFKMEIECWPEGLTEMRTAAGTEKLGKSDITEFSWHEDLRLNAPTLKQVSV